MADGKCYHHPSQDAVATCRGCGKGICKDCYDVYGVSSGEYAGQALCYDCTSQLVAENVSGVDKFKQQVKKELIFMVIGMVIGGILGVMTGQVSTFIILVLWGGSALMVLQGFLAMIKMGSNLASGSYGGFIGGIIGIGKLIVAPVVTVVKIFKRVHQIKQASEIIASDSRTLQEMRDYFAYTQAMENNKGVDLAKLAEQGSELFNNTYAQAVLNKGEKEAQAELRQSVVTISANGEIIRNFDKKPEKKAA